MLQVVDMTLDFFPPFRARLWLQGTFQISGVQRSFHNLFIALYLGYVTLFMEDPTFLNDAPIVP